MTTLLSPSRVDFARSVKTSSAVLIVLMLINQEHRGHSTTADEIRDIIEMDVRTISNHLRSLSARNLALFDGHGYVLVEENAMILGQQALALSPVTTQALDLPQAQALAPLSAQQTSPQMEDHNLERPAKDYTHSVCALVVEDSLILIKKDSSSTTYLDAQLAQKLTAAQVFQASDKLFGEPVFLVAGISTARALSVFAHVYDLQNARTPARLAFTMLKNGKEARQEYIDEPWHFFPEDYLDALHVARYQCNACEVQELFLARAALQAHVQESHALMAICPICQARFATNDLMTVHFDDQHQPKLVRPDETVTAKAAPGDVSAQRAWDKAKDMLRFEMPKASFETWVESSQAVRYDGNVLQVGTRNAYARDWLENRLTATVQKMLSGILGKDVMVEFVVAELDGE